MNEMFESISHSNGFWVGMNGVAIIVVFFLRGYRWKILLQNAGENPKYFYVLYSLCIGFFINSFTPRFGEVARCTTLKKADGVPMARSLGTMVTERMWDVLILGLGLVVIFILEVSRLKPIWVELMDGIRKMLTENGLLFSGIMLLLVVLLLVAYLILKSRKTFEKGRQFILEFWQTLKLSFKIKRYPRFLIVTALIWGVLTLMNYFCLLALEETSGSSFYFAFVIVFVAGIGWAIPSPSGIGTTHFIILHLFGAFSLSGSSAVAYGVLSNGLTFVFTILIGGISLILYRLFNKKKHSQKAIVTTVD